MKLVELHAPVLYLNMLVEGRIEFTAAQFKDKILAAMEKDGSAKKIKDELELVNFISANADIGKKVNTVWLTKQYILGHYKVEDAGRIRGELEKFDKFKSKLEVKDLNQYKSLEQLYDALEQFDESDIPVSNNAKAAAIKKDAEVFFEAPGFKVIIPRTEEAACLYGSGTKWCTAAKDNNQFDNYSKDGDLMIIMSKLGGKDRKFQFHYESESFMDERDVEVKATEIKALSELPAYTAFINKLIAKHYKEHLPK